MSETLDRAKEVEARFGIGHSTFYAQVADGLIAPPVNVGPRAKRFIRSEINAVINARITGKSENEIRRLVKTLIGKRKNVAKTE